MTTSLWGAGQAWLAISAVVACGAGVGALWSDVAVLDMRAWFFLVLLSIPSSQSIAIPLSGVWGLVVAGQGWRRDGSWLGLQASGGGGASLLPAALVLSLLVGGLTGVATWWVEPSARRAVHHVLDRSIADAVLWPGQEAQLGPVQVRVGPQHEGWYHDVFLAVQGAVGTAARARVLRGPEGLIVELEDGLVSGPGETPWSLRFTRWRRPLPALVGRRLELGERSYSELIEVAERTEARGGEASYERSVAAKRLTHPLGAALAVLASLALAFRRHGTLSVMGLGLAYLGAVRVGDGLAASLGPALSSLSAPVLVLAVAIAAWASWRTR